MKVVFIGGSLHGVVASVEEAIAKYPVRGYSPDWSEVRKAGGFCSRPELDNQPMFEGYLGPMWDGGMLRYETQEVYDLYFD